MQCPSCKSHLKYITFTRPASGLYSCYGVGYKTHHLKIEIDLLEISIFIYRQFYKITHIYKVIQFESNISDVSFNLWILSSVTSVQNNLMNVRKALVFCEYKVRVCICFEKEVFLCEMMDNYIYSYSYVEGYGWILERLGQKCMFKQEVGPQRNALVRDTGQVYTYVREKELV